MVSSTTTFLTIALAALATMGCGGGTEPEAACRVIEQQDGSILTERGKYSPSCGEAGPDNRVLVFQDAEHPGFDPNTLFRLRIRWGRNSRLRLRRLWPDDLDFRFRPATAWVQGKRVEEPLDLRFVRLAVHGRAPAVPALATTSFIWFVELTLRALLAGVRVDETPVPVAASHHDEHALPVALFEELDAEAALELARSAGRQAAQEHRIVLEERPLAVDVEIARPVLEGRDPRGVGHGAQQAIGVGLHLDAAFGQRWRAGVRPVARFTRHGAEPRLAVGPARGRLVRRGRRGDRGALPDYQPGDQIGERVR